MLCFFSSSTKTLIDSSVRLQISLLDYSVSFKPCFSFRQDFIARIKSLQLNSRLKCQKPCNIQQLLWLLVTPDNRKQTNLKELSYGILNWTGGNASLALDNSFHIWNRETTVFIWFYLWTLFFRAYHQVNVIVNLFPPFLISICWPVKYEMCKSSFNFNTLLLTFKNCFHLLSLKGCLIEFWVPIGKRNMKNKCFTVNNDFPLSKLPWTTRTRQVAIEFEIGIIYTLDVINYNKGLWKDHHKAQT